MAWIVGIICIILIVVFWRIFASIAVIAAVGLALILLYVKIENDQNQRNQIAAEQRHVIAVQELRTKIAKAQASAKGVSRTWEVSTEIDPASGAKVPRNASVLSDDGLCRLQFEQRINRARLAGVYCRDFKVSTGDIEVKFDNRSTSDKMRVEKFSNGDDVFIPSSQNSYGSYLQYDELLRRMTVAQKLALLLNVDQVGQQWITFSLLGTGSAFAAIGAIQSTP